MSKSVQERCEELQRAIADMSAVVARFPDAVIEGNDIVSEGVTFENADVVRAEETPLFGDRRTVALRLGLRLDDGLVVYEPSRFNVRYAAPVLERVMATAEGRAALILAMKEKR